MRFWLYMLAIVVLGVTLLPILSMVGDTFMTPEGINFSAYAVFYEHMVQKSFETSLLLGVAVATVTTFVGTLLGVLIAKTDLPFGKIWLFMFAVPLLIPPYMLAYGWFEVVGREGFWGEMLFGFWGVFWVLFCIYLPIPLFLTQLFLKQIDPRLEEAALLTAGWGKVLRYVTLPLIMPAWILSFLLLFMLTFGEQSVANFLRVALFSLESFTYFSAFYDFKTATVLAVPMVMVALVLLGMEQIWIDRGIVQMQKFHEVKRIGLGVWRMPALLLTGGLVILILFVPLWHLLMQSTSLSLWQEVMQKAAAPLFHSYLYATTGATLLLFFGFFGAYFITLRLRGSRLYDAALIFMFALPPAVIGIASILFWNRPLTNFIYATPLIVLLGYLGKYLTLTTKITQNHLLQIPSSQIEAAQMAGATPFQTLRYILFPLSKRVLFIAWMIGFVFILRETTMTMLLYPPGYETLPVYTLTQMANGDPKTVAVLTLLMILVAVLPLAILYPLSRRIDG